MASDPTQQRGTGSPVSADQTDQPVGSAGPPRDEEVDPAVVTGAMAGSQPALSDEVVPNRSGSGGSGGPTDPDAPLAEDGTGGRSMDEMLSPESAERGPRH